MTWKEKPYAKVLLEFGFSVKNYTDFLDSRLLTRFLTPFHGGPKFRPHNHLKLWIDRPVKMFAKFRCSCYCKNEYSKLEIRSRICCRARKADQNDCSLIFDHLIRKFIFSKKWKLAEALSPMSWPADWNIVCFPRWFLANSWPECF